MKYFFTLEKQNYNNKTMFAIIKDGKICKDQRTILDEQYCFYKALYTSDRNVHFEMTNGGNVMLNNIQKSSLEQNLTIEELHTAALSMKRNKVAGCDGLSLEFYLQFFEQIKESLYKNVY